MPFDQKFNKVKYNTLQGLSSWRYLDGVTRKSNIENYAN